MSQRPTSTTAASSRSTTRQPTAPSSGPLTARVADGPPEVAVRTAGTFRRGIAALLDSVPILGATVGLAWVLAPHLNLPALAGHWNLLDASVDLYNAEPLVLALPAAVLLVILLTWHLVFGALLGASPGKLALGLRMVGPSGARVGPGRATLHALIRPLSLTLLGFGHLWSIADPARRTLYDRVAGVYVIIPDRQATQGDANGPTRGAPSVATGSVAGYLIHEEQQHR